MSTVFTSQRGYGRFQALFSDPPFQAFNTNQGEQIFRALLERFGPVGLRVGQFKVHNGDGDLGRAHFSCSLLDFVVTLRIGLEHLELETYQLELIGVARFSALAADAVQAIAPICRANPFSNYQTDLSLHGPLTDLDPKLYLAGFFAKPPAALGPSTGSACTFYYGPVADRTFSTIALDLSGIVDGGLLFRNRTGWDPAKVTAEKLSDAVETVMALALADVGLALT